MMDRFDIVAILPAEDLERARQRYEEKLGLLPFAKDEAGLRYRSGSGELFVYQTGNARTAKNTAAGWYVDDIEAVVEDLRGRGVVFAEYDFPA